MTCVRFLGPHWAGGLALPQNGHKSFIKTSLPSPYPRESCGGFLMAIKTFILPLGGGAVAATAINAWLMVSLPVTMAAVPRSVESEADLPSPEYLSSADLDAILERNIFGFTVEPDPALIEEDPY